MVDVSNNTSGVLDVDGEKSLTFLCVLITCPKQEMKKQSIMVCT
jgi:hypothetical protein